MNNADTAHTTALNHSVFVLQVEPAAAPAAVCQNQTVFEYQQGPAVEPADLLLPDEDPTDLMLLLVPVALVAPVKSSALVPVPKLLHGFALSPPVEPRPVIHRKLPLLPLVVPHLKPVYQKDLFISACMAC